MEYQLPSEELFWLPQLTCGSCPRRFGGAHEEIELARWRIRELHKVLRERGYTPEDIDQLFQRRQYLTVKATGRDEYYRIPVTMKAVLDQWVETAQICCRRTLMQELHRNFYPPISAGVAKVSQVKDDARDKSLLSSEKETRTRRNLKEEGGTAQTEFQMGIPEITFHPYKPDPKRVFYVTDGIVQEMVTQMIESQQAREEYLEKYNPDYVNEKMFLRRMMVKLPPGALISNNPEAELVMRTEQDLPVEYLWPDDASMQELEESGIQWIRIVRNSEKIGAKPPEIIYESPAPVKTDIFTPPKLKRMRVIRMTYENEKLQFRPVNNSKSETAMILIDPSIADIFKGFSSHRIRELIKMKLESVSLWAIRLGEYEQLVPETSLGALDTKSIMSAVPRAKFDSVVVGTINVNETLSRLGILKGILPEVTAKERMRMVKVGAGYEVPNVRGKYAYYGL